MTRQFQHPVQDVMRALGGVGRTTVYNLAASGQLDMVHIGRRVFVTDESLCRYVESLKQPSELRSEVA